MKKMSEKAGKSPLRDLVREAHLKAFELTQLLGEIDTLSPSIEDEDAEAIEDLYCAADELQGDLYEFIFGEE